MRRDAQGRHVVALDHSISLDPSVTGRVFVANADLHSHGVAAPDLGIGAVRNALAGGVKGYVVTGTRNNLGPPARHGAAQIGAAARMHHHRRPPGAPAHQGGYRELSGREVEVLRGLAAGETVVVEGAFVLKAEAEKLRGGGADEH